GEFDQTAELEVTRLAAVPRAGITVTKTAPMTAGAAKAANNTCSGNPVDSSRLPYSGPRIAPNRPTDSAAPIAVARICTGYRLAMNTLTSVWAPTVPIPASTTATYSIDIGS